MIGYYIHHEGHGHLHRAVAVAQALGEPVTGFSSLPPPPDWPGAWIQLDRDDTDDDDGLDPTARNRLHWVPLGHHGLRARMAEVAAWIRHVSPSVFVVDASVEVAVLVRLHGIPVVAVVGPGVRDDAAHSLGFDVADAMVGCWPAAAKGMLRGVPPAVLERVHAVGALSRFPVAERLPRRPGARRVVLLSGTGGSTLDAATLDIAQKSTPDWEWTVLDQDLGTWVDDPYEHLLDADVVITHAAQNVLAEVAASRTPAVIVPQERPHREQRVTAEVLAQGAWPAVVTDSWPREDWAELLERAASLCGQDWVSWCDGDAADRVADVVRETRLKETG